MKKDFKVKCPQCSLSFSYYESESRPFCSTKCQQIDLGHWFKESYTVPVKENGKMGMESEEKKHDQKQADNAGQDREHEADYENDHESGYGEDYGESEKDEDYNESDYH